MEGKLIKTEVNYILENDKGVIIASTSLKKKGLSLSLKNCEAIANGYDLDELAKEASDGLIENHIWAISMTFFKAGFQKALELLGDKKFSEEDILIIRNKFVNILPIGDVSTWDMIKASKDFTSWFDNYIQSLQQNEWDVIIEMECCGNYSSCNWNCEHSPKPKLDGDGCLILKRK